MNAGNPNHKKCGVYGVGKSAPNISKERKT
jgi:hypothetical protein